jgi:hypothetical protein
MESKKTQIFALPLFASSILVLSCFFGRNSSVIRSGCPLTFI